ncbi:uncharacterized protein LOC144782909 [Lissotriton helveticus]
MEEFSFQIPSFVHHENEEGFIFRCIGKCLAACDDNALILHFLRSMFLSARFILTPNHSDIVIGFQTCARAHEFECRQVLEEFKGSLLATERDPSILLEEVTPPEHRDAFDMPTIAAEKYLEDMIKSMKNTLKLCDYILSK